MGKATNQQPIKQSRISLFLLPIMIAVVSGFFGGYFGAQSNNLKGDSDSTVQREIINNEGDLINTIAKDVGPSVVSVNVKSLGVAQDIF